MDCSTVLRDTSLILQNFIRRNIPALNADNRILLKSPADLETTSTPVLSLFLYHMMENGYLRNNELEKGEGGKWQQPPAVLDLHYLLTPYGQDQEQELLILENLIQLFQDQAVFNAPGQNGYQIRAQRLNLAFEELTKLWERFPQKAYKLSLAYAITPVRIPSCGKPQDRTSVKERKIRTEICGKGGVI